MPRSFFLFTFLFLAISASVCQADPPSEGAALTLEDCYKLALQQSEQVALRQELIAQAESRFTQALSGILPRVSFSSSDKRQDGSGGSAFTLFGANRQEPARCGGQTGFRSHLLRRGGQQ
jgi:outer membrane protein TolC